MKILTLSSDPSISIDVLHVYTARKYCCSRWLLGVNLGLDILYEND